MPIGRKSRPQRIWLDRRAVASHPSPKRINEKKCVGLKRDSVGEQIGGSFGQSGEGPVQVDHPVSVPRESELAHRVVRAFVPSLEESGQGRRSRTSNRRHGCPIGDYRQRYLTEPFQFVVHGSLLYGSAITSRGPSSAFQKVASIPSSTWHRITRVRLKHSNFARWCPQWGRQAGDPATQYPDHQTCADGPPSPRSVAEVAILERHRLGRGRWFGNRLPGHLPGLHENGPLVQGPFADDLLADHSVQLRVGERVSAGPPEAVCPLRGVQQNRVVLTLGPNAVWSSDDLASKHHWHHRLRNGCAS